MLTALSSREKDEEAEDFVADRERVETKDVLRLEKILLMTFRERGGEQWDGWTEVGVERVGGKSQRGGRGLEGKGS